MSRSRPRRSVAAATITAALSLVAAGCGTFDDSDESEKAQRLRYAYAFTPVAALSPYSDDAVTSYGVGVTETLVTLDPSGEPAASLATSWEQVDDLTWSFDLQPDVTFHDGTPMTAQTVAASLTRATEANPRPRALTGSKLRVTAEDEDTVQVRTAKPDPVLVQRLTSPELVILSPDAYEDPNAPDPVGTGTGPYRIVEVNGTTSATLDAYDDYWGGAPGLDGIEVSFVAKGESRASTFRAGRTDLAQALPASELGQFDADDLLAVPLPRTVSVHLTQDSEVFSDAGLREAARATIAEVDLASTIYDGYADSAEGLFAPGVSTWAADRAEANHPTATEPDGEQITLATFSDRPELVEIATALADALRERGFGVKVVAQEYNQLEAKFLDGTYDAVIMSRSYGQDTADPISYLQADFGCEGGYNISLFCDPKIDAELADAAEESDVDTRNAAALAVERQLLDRVAVIPLVHDRTQFAVADGLTGLAGDPWERAVITKDTTFE